MEIQPEVMSDSKPMPKPPIIRGARACTVCRTAKMKCVGAEDGQKPCDRCKRANVECVFEKHRRGRKPGSKLSEASKMLRRLEKGLNSAKMKSQATEPRIYDQDGLLPATRSADRYNSSSGQFSPKEHPSLGLSSYPQGESYPQSSIGSRSADMDDEEDADHNEDPIFPQKLIRQESQRNSFFRTILNPEASPTPNDHASQGTPFQSRSVSSRTGLHDPITAGIVTEEDAKALFDNIFIRLNPFINLFDPALHTVPYVRQKCPFLFTTLIMAGCKFFRPESFKECQKLANGFAVQAFAEGWKRVEVVQAFACLTYWKDPDDSDNNRTWTYIGYACRMAVELKLNRYVNVPPANETQIQMIERRNRERTYLVLFVHDRSLSTQTGMPWMLPEDEIIRQSKSWHKQGGSTVRPEDVIVAAFVALRCIVAETTEVFKRKGSGSHPVDTEAVLRECNDKLSKWADFWQHEMDQAGGESFHTSFLRFFRLYVTLFLNSFGIHAVIQPSGHPGRSPHPISICCASALDSLKIVSGDFANLHMLPYGQESLMVMSAYSAVSLLRLLRSQKPAVDAQLTDISASQIHTIIAQTAKAYEIASQISTQSTSTSVHARFLRHLLAYDNSKAQQADRQQSHSGGITIAPQLQCRFRFLSQFIIMLKDYSSAPSTPSNIINDIPQVHHDQYQVLALSHGCEERDYSASLFSRNDTQSIGGSTAYSYAPQAPQCATEADVIYWRHMFSELGFGDNQGNQVAIPQAGYTPYLDTANHLQHVNHPQVPLPYGHHIHQMSIYGHQ